MIEKIVGLIALALLSVLFWLYQKNQEQKEKSVEPTFILSASKIWWDWIAEHSNKFGWWSVIEDDYYGNYKFRILIFEVTGLKLSRLEIERTLNNYAVIMGYSVRFKVAIKKEPERDLVKIIYITPETALDYKRMILINKQVKEKTEKEKQFDNRPMGPIKL